MATSGNPPKKIDKLRGLMIAGEWGKALSMAAKWADLGEHRDAIKAAASAKLSPAFYASMGKDPEALVAAGIEALRARYGNFTGALYLDKSKPAAFFGPLLVNAPQWVQADSLDELRRRFPRASAFHEWSAAANAWVVVG